MSTQLAKPGHPVDLARLAAAAGTKHESLLVKTSNVEVRYLAVPPDSSVPTHETPGETIIQCLEGRVYLSAEQGSGALKAGQFLYLNMNKEFSIHGVEHATLLVIIIVPKEGPNVALIG